jgi:excisionase family DNA binding protein
MDAQEVTRQTRFEDLPEWLSVGEVQAYLGLGRATVYALIRTSAIPSRRFGRLVRVHRSAVAPTQDAPIAVVRRRA